MRFGVKMKGLFSRAVLLFRLGVETSELGFGVFLCVLVRDSGYECRLETSPFVELGTDIPSSPISGTFSIAGSCSFRCRKVSVRRGLHDEISSIRLNQLTPSYETEQNAKPEPDQPPTRPCAVPQTESRNPEPVKLKPQTMNP